ncbi:MAG: methyltransferase domain-containing protein, partial [Nanoarchaeota archaeon]
MAINSFDTSYKTSKCFWGSKPHAIIKEILNFKRSGDVLDLGVGEGRDALFLAKNGFSVTGVDISETGIQKF